MKKLLNNAMCLASDAFFGCNRRKPQSMDEFLMDAQDLSDTERHWAEAYIELWRATEMLESDHPATYGKFHEEPDVIQALIPTCPKSGTDFKLAKEAYGTSVWIETPNGLVSIYYDLQNRTTCVRTYDGGDIEDSEISHEYQVVMKKIKPLFEVGKWNLWKDYDMGHNWIYDMYTGRKFSVGCVSSSTFDEIRDGEKFPNVYKADDVEGVSALFDMACMAEAAAKASGCENCFFVFKLLP